MKIKVVTPFDMQWVDGYKRSLSSHDVSVVKMPSLDEVDVTVFMWFDKNTVDFINDFEKKGKYVVFMRRYEYYSGHWRSVDWNKIDHLIFVNDFFAWATLKTLNGSAPKHSVIYNGISEDKWTFSERCPGNKIAMVGFINQKKNFPLALQILAGLPDTYELHIAGGIQDAQVMDYVVNISRDIKRRVVVNGQLPHGFINKWLEDKNYLLSCAISEGCPNNVIEAMAKGIKPIIHRWPGATEIFGNELTFSTVNEAVEKIRHRNYSSRLYHDIALERFGSGNYEKVKEIIESL